MTSGTVAIRQKIGQDDGALRWFGEPVWVSKGPPASLINLIPRFARRPFSLLNLESSPGAESNSLFPNGENKLCDLIVREPLNDAECETPVGVVSKHYKLVQHTELFQGACEALEAASDPHLSAHFALGRARAIW